MPLATDAPKHGIEHQPDRDGQDADEGSEERLGHEVGSACAFGVGTATGIS